MSTNRSSELHRRCTQKGFHPRHVAEVGVWHPEHANAVAFINEGVRTTLVEPDPRSVEIIRERFGDCPHVELHPVAVCSENGKVHLAQCSASTFVSTLPTSPAQVNDGYEVRKEDLFEVDAQRFDEIDDGTIELLIVDIEGSEWFVLEHMRSRPGVVSLETHGKLYVNPYMPQIKAWLDEYGYEPWYKDKSDTVYVRRGLFDLTGLDRLRLRCTEAQLAWHRFRKRVFRRR